MVDLVYRNEVEALSTWTRLWRIKKIQDFEKIVFNRMIKPIFNTIPLLLCSHWLSATKAWDHILTDICVVLFDFDEIGFYWNIYTSKLWVIIQLLFFKNLCPIRFVCDRRTKFNSVYQKGCLKLGVVRAGGRTGLSKVRH